MTDKGISQKTQTMMLVGAGIVAVGALAAWTLTQK